MQFYNKERLENSYETLRIFYGSHTEAAEALGITPDHYRKIRNKRTVMSTTLRKLTILLAEKVSDLDD